MQRPVSLTRLAFKPLLIVLAATALLLPLGCGGGGGGAGGGGTALSVVSTSPADGTSVNPASLTIFSITFNQAMSTWYDTQPVKIEETKDGITSDITSAVFDTAGTWSNGNRTATVPITYFFKEGATYTVTALAGIFTSADGHPLTADYVSVFTTTSTVPYVVGTIPSNMATSVATSVQVAINFSEPMDTTTFDKNASINPSASPGTVAWSAGDTVLILDFAPGNLATDTTYTLSITSAVKDARGTNLASSFSVTFSTGASLATGGIVGAFQDDPDSSYDDSLVRSTVVLFASDPSSGGSDPVAFASAPAGAYSFHYLADGTYWLGGIVDSNGDGDLNEWKGDSFSFYADPLTATSVTVSGGNVRSGIDFTLKDTEAISGRITCDSSMGSVDMSSDLDAPYFYAFSGTDLYTGAAVLSNELSSTTVSEAVSSDEIDYWLNPYFASDISVEGTYWNGVSTVSRDYIPAGSYVVACYSYNNNTDADLFGFSSVASIASTGADATGKDIVLFETTSVDGYVMRIDSMTSMPAIYGSARVSLVGWPLQTAISNNSGSYYSGTTLVSASTGFFQYDYAPVGKEVYFHVAPDPNDGAAYISINRGDFTTFDSMGSSDNELILIKRSLIQSWANLLPGSPAINPAKAQIGGSVWDSGLDQPVAGAHISMEGVTTWYFTDDTFTALDQNGTRAIDGPQFIMVNVTPPASGDRAVGTMTRPGQDPQPGYFPLRAGELTVLNIQ